MNRSVALRRSMRRVGVGSTRSRFDSRRQGGLGSSLSCDDLDGCCLSASSGVGCVRGRQRSAISMSAWDGPSRRAANGWSGLGARSERCIRRAAESRRAAAARSKIIGLTIRDSSYLPADDHRNPTDARPSLNGEAVRMHRCEVHAAATLVLFAHSAWAWRVSPVAIRWLGSDLRSRQRREYRPNIPAPALRRVFASGRLVRPRTHHVMN
jgi:hypothetical protein